MLPAVGYEYRGQQIEVLLNESGDPLFNPHDIWAGLELGKEAIKKALRGMKDGIHKIHLSKENIINLGGTSSNPKDIPPNGRYYVTEPGLYRMVMNSRKPEAEEFKDWIACDVLPSIRKQGYYGNVPQQFQIPQTLGEALRLAADQQEQIEAQQEKIAIDAPKIEAFEQLMDADGNAPMSKAAKILGIGSIQLFKFLRENKILMKSDWNVPYQAYMNRGWFKIKVGTYLHKDGTPGASSTTMVTPKGIEGIRRLLKKKGIIVEDNLFKDMTEQA